MNSIAVQEEVQSLKDHGRYEAAVEHLQLPESKASLSPLRHAQTLSEVLLAQGYLGKTLRCIEDAISAARNAPCDDSEVLLRLRMRMWANAIRPAAHPSLKGLSASYQDGKQAIEELGKLCNESDVREDVICIRIAYCRLLGLIKAFLHPQIENEIRDIVSWDYGAFKTLFSRTKWRLCLFVARNCLDTLGGYPPSDAERVKIQALVEGILAIGENPIVPLAIRAQAFDTLASHCESIDQPESRETWESNASSLYNKSQHVCGSQELRLRQLCRLCNMEPGKVKGYLAEAQEILAEFERNKLMKAQMQGIQNLLNIGKDIQYLELKVTFSDMLRELGEASEARVMPLLSAFRLAATWVTHTGRGSQVLETCLPLFEALDENDCRFLKGSISQIISQAYLQLKKTEEALDWAKTCASLWKDCGSRQRASGTYVVLMATPSLKNMSREGFDKFVKDWSQIIEEDRTAGLHESVAQKTEIILTHLIERHDARATDWAPAYQAAIEAIPSQNMALKDGNMAQELQRRAVLMIAQNQAHPGTGPEEQALGLLREAVDLYNKHQMEFHKFTTFQIQARTHLAIFQKTMAIFNLQQWAELMQSVIEGFRELGISSSVSFATASFALTLTEYSARGIILPDAAIQSLKSAEEAQNEERVNASVASGIQALVEKQRIRADLATDRLYAAGFSTCRQPGMEEELWCWTQRSKGRSLSDSLGLAFVIPERIIVQVRADEEAHQLYVRELEILDALNSTPEMERLSLRSQLHVTRSLMAKSAVLREVLDLRAGTPISRGQLSELVASYEAVKLEGRKPSREEEEEEQDQREPGVVFVDWIFSGQDVLLLSIRAGEEPFVSQCSVSRAELEQWHHKYKIGQGFQSGLWDTDLEEGDVEYCLRKIDGLVAPLERRSREGDLLVFCPTGKLHSIPLHALWINGDALIARNPIVYCASLTASYQCWSRCLGTASSADTNQAQRDLKMNVMAAYEPGHETTFVESERSRIYKSMVELGVLMSSASVLCGSEATTAAFQQVIQDSSSQIFHFFGHSLFDAARVLNQGLVLYDGTFRLEDAFRLRLHGQHVTLLSCDSASQGISSGDEPLGLVTALLCAGAGSVLGTIWPVPSEAGRFFSEAFYRNLRRACPVRRKEHVHSDAGAIQRTMIDLANCAREAILDLRDNAVTRHPSEWASIVLHGSPIMIL